MAFEYSAGDRINNYTRLRVADKDRLIRNAKREGFIIDDRGRVYANNEVGSKVDDYRRLNSAKQARIRQEYRRKGLDVTNQGVIVPKGYYATNTGKIMSKSVAFEARSQEVADYAYNRAVSRQDQSTPRDMVISNGLGQSKAYELQSPSERRETADYSAKLINTKEGTIYRGKENGFSNTIRSDSGLFNRSGSPYLGDSLDSSQGQKQINFVKPSSDVFGKQTFSGWFSKTESSLELGRKKYYNSPIVGGAYTVGAFGFGVVKGVGLFVSDVSPISFDTGKWRIPFSGGFSFVKSAVTDPRGTYNIVSSEASQKPIGFLGELVGVRYGGKVLGKGFSFAKDTYVSAGSKFVAPEKVFDVGVLQGKTRFPMAESVSQSLKEFSKSDRVVTASPGKIGGDVVQVGKKAKLGLEDPGIYVAPKGKGSPAFLRVDGEAYSFTFNPLKSVKDSFSVPTVTEFQVKGVRLQPRSVVSQPGFSASASFFESSGGKSGFAFITKRSEIGLGNVPRQTFKNPVSGKTRFELGTSELEAVVPLSAKFKYTPKSFVSRVKGYDSYTRFRGRNVAIREAKVLGDGVFVDSSVLSKGSRIVSGKRIVSESSAFSSRSRSPYSFLRFSSLSRGSSSSRFSSLSRGSSSSSSSPVGSSIVSSSFSGGSSLSRPTSSSGSSSFSSSFPSSYPYPSGSSSSGSSSTPRPPIVPPPIITNFKFKPRKRSTEKVSRVKVFTDKFVPKYNPSIEASLFNVRARSTNVRLANTGLVLRPIIVGGK